MRNFGRTRGAETKRRPSKGTSMECTPTEDGHEPEGKKSPKNQRYRINPKERKKSKEKMTRDRNRKREYG